MTEHEDEDGRRRVTMKTHIVRPRFPRIIPDDDAARLEAHRRCLRIGRSETYRAAERFRREWLLSGVDQI
jgi:hypothetical protein